jgi:Fe-S-cluster containining protein
LTKRSRKKSRKTARTFRDEAGRVHLVVRRDPASGKGLVLLAAPLFGEPWQDEVTVSTANTVLAVVREIPNLERVLEATRSAMVSTSRLVDGLLARAPAGSVACKAGCDHCCHVVVGITAPEALVIFEHLKRSRSTLELARLTARVDEFCDRTRGLSSSERFLPEYSCVFLEKGRCSIYEVRPFACRGMNSLDATACETRLRDPEARAEFVREGGGHLFVEPIQAFRAVSAGLQLALLELYRLDVRPLELSTAIHILLHGNDSALVGAWIAGQRPFEAAELR